MLPAAFRMFKGYGQMDCINYIKSNVKVQIEANRPDPPTDVPMVEEFKRDEQEVEENKAIEEPTFQKAPVTEEFKETQA